MSSFLTVPWFARGHLLHRSREIASALTRHGLGWVVVQLGLGDLVPFERGWLGHPKRARAYSQAEHLRMALGELGATFIKLGQALATRPDLLPADYVAEFSKLQDAAPPVPFEQICQLFCDEIGRSPDQVFAHFDPEPLASASIGQVHAGDLRGPSHESITVKVQRPGVAAQVDEDLEIITGMAEWAEGHTAFGRNYNLPVLAEEFAFTLRCELDYLREGHNADLFRRNFAGDATVRIPRVYHELSTARVLTMERMSGIKIDDVAGLDHAGIDRHTVAENAVRVMLREVFEFGFFHADPHPGNFFVEPDGSIALMDFGMVGRLDDQTLERLLRAGAAIARRDTERLTDEFYALGLAGAEAKRSRLQRDLDHLLDRLAGQPIKDLAAAQITNEIMAIASRHRLQLPGELVMLLRVVAMSEGLGARLDPDFHLFEFAAPSLQEFWLKRRSLKAATVRVGQAAWDAAELGLELPRRTSRLLGRLERGEVGFKIEHEGLPEFSRQLRHMANRLALSILLAATIVGLGLLMVIYHPPGWEVIGGWVLAVAFVIAAGFGAWLMWSIWRSG